MRQNVINRLVDKCLDTKWKKGSNEKVAGICPFCLYMFKGNLSCKGCPVFNLFVEKQRLCNYLRSIEEYVYQLSDKELNLIRNKLISLRI